MREVERYYQATLDDPDICGNVWIDVTTMEDLGKGNAVEMHLRTGLKRVRRINITQPPAAAAQAAGQ